MNGTASDGMAYPPRFDDYGTLKLATAGAETLILMVCAPLFVVHKRQPVIRYRSWSVNLFSVSLWVASHWFEAALSLDGWVNQSTLRYVVALKAACVMAVLSSYHAIFIRHYYLLRLPVIQAEMLDYDTIMDPQRYDAARNEVENVKRLSTEAAAWRFYLPHMFVVVGTILAFAVTMDLDEYVRSPASTVFSRVRAGLYLFETLSSTMILLLYLPRAPNENFRIKTQFNAMAIASIGIAGITTFRQTVFPNDDSSTFLSVTIVGIDLVVPIVLIYSGSKYKVNSSTEVLRSKLAEQNIALGDVSGRRSTGSNSGASSGSGPGIAAMLSPYTPVGGTALPQALGVNMQAFARPVPRPESVIAFNSMPRPSSDVLANLTIPRILVDPMLRDAFERYLRLELSLENMLFIEAVRRYKTVVMSASATDRHIKNEAENIIHDFIRPLSVNEVNLPTPIISKLKIVYSSQIESARTVPREIALRLFDEAGEHIHYVLSVNHLQRFKSSTIFRQTFSV
ncbi:Regulator of G-protein signaling 20 [Polyrhizophydium stewartii]|uniref:Regulator of G-protein signaling 20 n=1 Tax=Polyrhizophydium stewartii TaxID=2732419 RepID=A0ABR4NBW0_9FUNG